MRAAFRLQPALQRAMLRAQPSLRRVRPGAVLVEPPANSRDWDTVAGGNLGLKAARAKEARDRGELGKRARKFIDAAIACASLAADALTLQVLSKKVKTKVVGYQSETHNPHRSNALLSGKSLARALACVGLCSESCQHSKAAHALAWEITARMQEHGAITATRATQAAMSLTLRYAEEFHRERRLSDEQLEALLIVREVLGVQAQCSYAEKNASYHDWLIELDDLDAFWERMDADSYKEQVVRCLGNTLTQHQDGAIKCLILSAPDWDRFDGKAARDSASYFELAHVDDVESRLLSPRRHRRASVAQVLAGTVCYVSYKEVTMRGIARLAVSELQLAFAYFNVVHCGLCAQKPAGVGETQFLLDVAKRLGANVKSQFGVGGRHSMTTWSGKLTFVPLLGECEQWGRLRDARVGVFRMLPLHDPAVYGHVYDILTSGRPVLGDHGIPKKLYSGDADWVPGPGL